MGSGKSTVSKILQERLKYDYIYTGKILREIATKYNMTTLELNKYAETHPEIDEEIDSTFKSLNDSNHLIVDSRLAWFFIPQSFKVFLKTNLIVSVSRISSDRERINEQYASKEEAANHIIARKSSENKRYMELYGANCTDLAQFNLIIDTSFLSPGKVTDLIVIEYKKWLMSNKPVKSYISPLNLYPTQSFLEFEDEDFNSPVRIVSINSFDYIVHGHKMTSYALKNDLDLLSVDYLGENSLTAKGTTCKEEILKAITPQLFYAWESFHSMKYLIYPI